MKAFSNVFGCGEFALRLQSFIAHIIYLIVTFLIVKKHNNKYVLLLGFIILNVNAHLLDYFSLARGYALSIAFMVWSLYQLVLFVEDKKQRHIIFCLMFSLIAIISNFSLITFTATMILVLELLFIKDFVNKKQFLQNNLFLFLAGLVIFLIYTGPITILLKHHELGFGGSKGLWVDTAITSIHSYLYLNPQFDILVFFYRFLVVITMLMGLVVIYKQIKTDKLIGLTYISIVFYLVLLASMLQHIVLNANYFQERFALFLVPLFFFNFLNCCLFASTMNYKWNVTFNSIAFLTVMGAVFIFVFAYNTTSTLYWSYDSCTKKMLTDLKLETKKSPNKSYKLGITWIFEPSINFYRETHSLNWLQEVNRDAINNSYDYYYVDSNEKLDSIKNNIILIKNYPELNTSLYKKIK